MSELTTDEARKRLDVSPQQVRALLRAGKIEGRQLASGEWIVDEDSLERRVALSHGRGRTWSALSSWALLCELSGQPELVELSDRTRARVRERIRLNTAEEISRKVAGRTKVTRYDADDVISVGADMVLTGSTAVDEIDSDLAPRFKTVEGYVRDEDMDGFIAEHMLIPDRRGHVVVYQVKDYWDRRANHAPTAVIAADLARSDSTRERSAGLAALEKMRQQWLASHTK